MRRNLPREAQTRILYRLIRYASLGFSGLIFLVLGLILWRKFSVEKATLESLRYGEIVTFALLLAVALGLVVLAYRIKQALAGKQ